MKITLDDEIECAQTVVDRYRNLWFNWIPGRRKRIRWKWAGDPEQWREWLAAHAILRRLKKLRRRECIASDAKEAMS